MRKKPTLVTQQNTKQSADDSEPNNKKHLQ